MDKIQELRCSIHDGENLGVITKEEAIKKANDLGLDLILIAPNGKPPVAKIMDYGKYKYQQEKKLKEQKKKQVKVETKEIKFSINIAQNDINYRIKKIIDFLSKKKLVKLSVVIKGREMSNTNAAKDLLLNIWKEVSNFGKIEKNPKLEGRTYTMTIAPK